MTQRILLVRAIVPRAPKIFPLILKKKKKLAKLPLVDDVREVANIRNNSKASKAIATTTTTTTTTTKTTTTTTTTTHLARRRRDVGSMMEPRVVVVWAINVNSPTSLRRKRDRHHTRRKVAREVRLPHDRVVEDPADSRAEVKEVRVRRDAVVAARRIEIEFFELPLKILSTKPKKNSDFLNLQMDPIYVVDRIN